MDNEKLKELQGELEDHQARLTLIDFLYSNIGITVELLSGIKLAPYQEIALKGMLTRHRSMMIWTRGGAKSFVAASLLRSSIKSLVRSFALAAINSLVIVFSLSLVLNEV